MHPNVEYRKTYPFCAMMNGLFTCIPSNTVYLNYWEQDQKDIILCLPVLIAKLFRLQKYLIVYESIKISITACVLFLSQSNIACISSFLFSFKDYYGVYDLVNQGVYLTCCKFIFLPFINFSCCLKLKGICFLFAILMLSDDLEMLKKEKAEHSYLSWIYLLYFINLLKCIGIRDK